MYKKACVALLCMGVAGAQQSAAQTVLLEKTAEYLKKDRLAEAQEAIELAAKHEATKNEARTWYLKGFVYKELYKKTQSRPEHRETALAALHKSVALDTRKAYANSVNSILDFLYSSYYNESLDLLNDKQYERALEGLKRFLEYRAKHKPDEFYAEALYHAGFASYSMNKKTDAKQYYEQALAKGHKSPPLYDDLTQIYLGLNDKPRALQVIEAGRRAFPDDANLRVSEINVALQLKEHTRAEKLIEQHLETNPADTDALMVAGTVYEALSKKDTARQEMYFNKRKDVYKKILATDADNFLANYNLGITYYNYAVDLINTPNVLDETITQFNQRIEVISMLIVEAKPYIEKASKLSPQNVNSLKALSGIYHYLNDREQFQQTQNRIKLLGSN